MKRSLKSLACLMLGLAFISCAGHCLVEQAFAISEHSAEHCESHNGASDHDDSHHHSDNDHHHQSPCASSVSLLSQNTLFVNLLFTQAVPLPAQPLLLNASATSFSLNRTNLHEVEHQRKFLSDLSLAPNAPPASA